MKIKIFMIDVNEKMGEADIIFDSKEQKKLLLAFKRNEWIILKI